MSAVLAVALSLLAADRAATPIDFDTQVMPILTKAGCNSGACHGAAAGRGGFHLSLYGSRPADDFSEITSSLEGRRINYRQPDLSLLLKKPTEMLSHGGELRIDIDSPEHRLLVRWIAEGAKRHCLRRLKSYSFAASQGAELSVGSTIQLTAVAAFDDGTTADVLLQTIITAADPDATELSADGQVTLKTPGRHLLLARYLDRVQPLELIVPTDSLASPAQESESGDAATEIDRFVDDRLQQLRLGKAPRAGDATLIRRLSLDLTGRLPNPDTVVSFIRNDDVNKTKQLIDQLLASDAFVDFQTHRLAQLLRLNSLKSDSDVARKYYAWLRQNVAKDESWRAVVSRLLTAQGDTASNSSASFYNVTADPRAHAEFVSQVFLGVRLNCANCHDHPLDAWTQDDYHGLAAIFARVKRGPVIRLSGSGKVIHPATGEPAVAKIPGGEFLESESDQRAAFADWLTSESNPYFAKAAVNRIWAHLMGRGLVSPPDDLRATNPPTHPELLSYLASQFVDSGFRIRPVIREICLSSVYARSSRPLAGQQRYSYFLASAQPKTMSPEVFLDALNSVTASQTDTGGQPSAAVSFSGLTQPSATLDLLGRCTVGDVCESTTVAADDLTLQLHLLNGDLVNRGVALISKSESERIESAPIETIESIYLRCFSRLPVRAELDFWTEQLFEASDRGTREIIVRDFIWCLLTSHEFRTIH